MICYFYDNYFEIAGVVRRKQNKGMYSLPDWPEKVFQKRIASKQRLRRLHRRDLFKPGVK